jgi:hypothetical protein
MSMTVPLPPLGDTSWYDWASEVHDQVDALSSSALIIHTYNGVAFPARASIAPLTVPVAFHNHIDDTAPSDMVDGLDILLRRA